MYNPNMLFQAGVCREGIPAKLAPVVPVTFVYRSNMHGERPFLSETRAATWARKVSCAFVHGANMRRATLFRRESCSTTVTAVVASAFVDGSCVAGQLRARCKESSAICTLVRFARLVHRCLFNLGHGRVKARVEVKPSWVKGKTVWRTRT
jgi:hypothetical protein